MIDDTPNKNHTNLRNVITFAIAIVFGTFISACSGNSANPGTATAQADRAITMATQIASDLKSTRTAQENEIAATAQAALAGVQESEHWTVIFDDNFDVNTNDWPTGDEVDPLADVSYSLAEGKYRWHAKGKEGFVWWATPTMEDVEDFILSADIQQIEGPPYGEAGITYRVTQDYDYYLFEVDAQGEYAVYLRYQQDWYELLPWTPSPTIHVGSSNNLTALGRNAQFDLFINGQFVSTLTDDRLSSGTAGVLIGLSEPDDEGSWEFDNFQLRATGQ
jgi:hypothetical protein